MYAVVTTVRIAAFAGGSFSPSSSGTRFRLDRLALLRAKEGSGEITIVRSGRSSISTTVLCRHFEQ